MLSAAEKETVTDRFLPARQVCDRYGVSEMWVWRRLKDDSGFPRPIMISGRRFWRLSELEEWEGAQPVK
jgi:predicted DNA-binding transcriptional regulator AlpA